MTVIPGATEFGYDPVARVRVTGFGATAHENAHGSALLSDWTLSIDELTALCPNLEHVSLVVSWFGDDLRCGECTIRPKVEAANRSVQGASWSVAGLTRATAEVVSQHDGGPAYGGTPSDASVLAAIADLKARGLKVTLYPMVLMDIPAGNPTGQPAFPWRGRISCDPAPGTVGSPEGTGALDAQVAAFVGSSSGWGFRRMVRHYAALAGAAGAEALVIGSEMVGMTTLRGTSGFPFVTALVALAAEARALAPGRYRLTDLLRRQGGSDVAMGPAAAGNRLVLLDGNVAVLPVEPDWLGGELALRAFAGRHDATGTAFVATLGLGPVLPLPPVHLRSMRGAGGDVTLVWVRRSRADAGAWAAAEVPLEHLPEAYRVTIFDGATPVRSLDVLAPAALYTAAMQAADFGALPAAFDFTVAQLSPVFGPGHAAAGSFDA